MNNRLFLLSVLLISLVLINACANTAANFTDPAYPAISYADIKKRNPPLPLKVEVEYQEGGTPKGEPFPNANFTLRGEVERVLRQTGVVEPSPSATEKIHVVVNRTGIIMCQDTVTDAEFDTGWVCLASTTQTLAFKMTATLSKDGGSLTSNPVRHASHRLFGAVPSGLELRTPAENFKKITEEMLLHLLKDMQKDGFFE